MEKTLKTIEQKTVRLYEDDLIAIRADDGQIYVSVRHMCDSLGLSRQAQVRRIKRQEILNEGYKGGAILAPPSADGRGGGRQQAGLLRADLVPLWLSGVSTKSVKDEIRPKLLSFQKEAARVLWDAFQEGQLTAEPSFDELLKSASADTLEAYQMAMALVRLARNQIMIEARLESNETQLIDHEQRLEEIESTLGDPGRLVTPAQASQISQAVKAVAIALGKQTKRNEFGSVYGELYRKYEVTGYKQLPSNRFQECMDWLTEWHQGLVGDTPF